jgi:hypothetical protein
MIGELVADATAALLQGLAETVDGGLSAKTRELGGNAVAELYQFRQFACQSLVDFETVAKVRGAIVMRERLAKVTQVMPSDTQFDEWIGWTLDILKQVVRARIH